MILIGTMNLTRTRDRADFYCPTCGAVQGYRLRARRPFLTIYFIPTVPIGGAELFVQCDECRATWDPSVLEMDRESHERAQEAQVKEETLRAAILVVISDSVISEEEITSLQQISSGLLDQPVSREELGRLCSIAAQNKIQAKNYTMTVSRRWSQTQRRRALQAMFLAATAEGEVKPKQLAILAEMRDLFEMTDAEYESAIEEALRLEIT